jgi:hypothetical protein
VDKLCKTCTNQFNLLFVCLTRILHQISDDVAIFKIWQDQTRQSAMSVTQSENTADIWMVGDLDVLVEPLNV